MQAQEKELRTEIETLQNRIIELQTEKVDENGNEEKREKPAEEQPVYQTKDGRTIGKLKRVEGDNFLEAIKQYQDDSKNEKSNLSEETIKQLQEESRQKITTKAKENIEKFHRHQVRNSFIINDENGVVTGQKICFVRINSGNTV